MKGKRHERGIAGDNPFKGVGAMPRARPKRQDMHWSEICRNHPNKWLIVEALEAHTTPDHRHQLERLGRASLTGRW